MSDLKQQSTLLNIILNSSNQIHLLNSSMMNLNLIKQNRFEPNFEIVKNPIKILKEFAMCFRESIKQKNLILKIGKNVSGDKEVVGILAKHGSFIEAELYKQIMFNAFVNALKFSKPNGTISLEIYVNTSDYLPKLTQPFVEAGKSCFILETLIIDQGEGISKQK